MNQAVREAFDALRGLGTPEELEADSRRGIRPEEAPRVNAHIHLPPNFSAFESVEQALDLAAQQGVGILGASNYYDFEVYGEFAAGARRRGIFPLFGLETIVLEQDLLREGVKVNDPGNPGKMYLCGKGMARFGEPTAEAARILGVIRKNDAERMARMADRAAAIFAERGLPTGIGEKAVIERVVRRHGSPRETVVLQERHLAQAFQEALFERAPAGKRLETLQAILGAPSKARGPEDHVTVQNEIRSHLLKAGKPAFVEETFVGYEEACRLILELGGIPCYPVLADGASPICPFEEPVEGLVERIHAKNLHCAEFIPVRNRPEVLERYVLALRQAGIAVLGGTEHNTLDLIPLEPTCLDGAPVPGAVREAFLEGACVAAAHQFLLLHGRAGFVDGEGRPNPAYRFPNERIRAFAALGAAVIRRYLAKSPPRRS